MSTTKISTSTFYITPGAQSAIAESDQTPDEFLKRHLSGDWGDMSDDDKAQNDRLAARGGFLQSEYRTAGGVRIWVITNPDANDGKLRATTVMLPGEY